MIRKCEEIGCECAVDENDHLCGVHYVEFLLSDFKSLSAYLSFSAVVPDVFVGYLEKLGEKHV